MAGGILLGGDQPSGQSADQEVDRRMLQPNKIDVGEAAYESIHHALKRGEPHPSPAPVWRSLPSTSDTIPNTSERRNT
jgi:hypothetical protein